MSIGTPNLAQLGGGSNTISGVRTGCRGFEHHLGGPDGLPGVLDRLWRDPTPELVSEVPVSEGDTRGGLRWTGEGPRVGIRP